MYTLNRHKLIVPDKSSLSMGSNDNERIPMLVSIDLNMKSDEMSSIHTVDSLCFRAALEQYCRDPRNADAKALFQHLNRHDVRRDTNLVSKYMSFRTGIVMPDLVRSMQALMTLNEVTEVPEVSDSFISLCEYQGLYSSKHDMIEYFGLIGQLKCLLEVSQFTNLFLPIINDLIKDASSVDSLETWISKNKKLKKSMMKIVKKFSRNELHTKAYRDKFTAAETICKYIAVHANLHGIKYFVQFYKSVDPYNKIVDCLNGFLKVAMCKELVDTATKAMLVFTSDCQLDTISNINIIKCNCGLMSCKTCWGGQQACNSCGKNDCSCSNASCKKCNNYSFMNNACTRCGTNRYPSACNSCGKNDCNCSDTSCKNCNNYSFANNTCTRCGTNKYPSVCISCGSSNCNGKCYPVCTEKKRCLSCDKCIQDLSKLSMHDEVKSQRRELMMCDYSRCRKVIDPSKRIYSRKSNGLDKRYCGSDCMYSSSENE